MARVIINADDYGLSDGICRSILELFELGAISSTSMMMAAPNAISRIKDWGVEKLRGRAGVHLQLTGGSPLSPPNEVQSLLNLEQGTFRDLRKATSRIDPHEVEIEWRRQIDAAIDALGETPTHLDSHHGMHRRPELLGVYTKLAKELSVPVRGAVDKDISRQIMAAGVRCPDGMVREWSGKSLGLKELKHYIELALKRAPTSWTMEVVAHPGFSDNYLSSVSSLSIEREFEHRALAELSASGWLRSEGHHLISFQTL